MKKFVVTGAGGYIGSVLVTSLLESGHEVLAVDRFFFGIKPIEQHLNNPKFKILKKDIRDLTKSDLKGYEVVCDLASLSNDPAGELNPELTYQINRDGRIHVAKISKEAGVEKYILSSSCSVYGKGKEEVPLKETSPTEPISVYAKSTLQAEAEILPMASNDFSVTAFRNATVFGLSTRMRFDLVVNLMTLSAVQKNKIIIMGGGEQWRPLIHVKDVARAFIQAGTGDSKIINSQLINIGLSSFKIKNLAYIVREVLPFEVIVEIAPDDPDKRDYNVDFEKYRNLLGISPQFSIDQGVSEIYQALKNGSVDTGPRTNTVIWYKNIIDAKNLIDEIELNGRII